MILRTLVGLLCMAVPGWADCRQALALGLDISGSVDAREYRLQLDGLAEALQRPAVERALLRMPSATVDIAVFEWSDPGQLRRTQDWVTIATPEDLASVAARLREAQRPGFGPSTGLGSAMAAGAGMLAQRGSCWRHTLDLSGDGPSNTGPRPREIREGRDLADVVVNALVIGSVGPENDAARREETAALSSYFRAEVIHGPGAFVETAEGFADYADAMERKLLRELDLMLAGAVPGPGPAAAQ